MAFLRRAEKREKNVSQCDDAPLVLWRFSRGHAWKAHLTMHVLDFLRALRQRLRRPRHAPLKNLLEPPHQVDPHRAFDPQSLQDRLYRRCRLRLPTTRTMTPCPSEQCQVILQRYRQVPIDARSHTRRTHLQARLAPFIQREEC